MQLDYQFGLTGFPLKTFEKNDNNTKRIDHLLKLKYADLIVQAGKHYIQNFIPSPIKNEDEFWMCSCFPDKYITPIRINIYWHEVFHVKTEVGNDICNLLVFTDQEYISEEIAEELETNITGLRFDKKFSYKKGLDSQLAAFLPITSYFDFVSDDRVFESIKHYNYMLSNKGKRVHKGHNYDLARLLLQK